MSLKRLISMTAVCLLGALALSGGQAIAQQPDDTFAKVECDFLPGSVTGTADDGINSLATDTNQGQSHDPASLFDTDPGSFQFAGRAYCQGEDKASEWVGKGGGAGPQSLAQNILINAKGIYDNLFCGTAVAKGTAVLRNIAPRLGDPPNITNHDLEIHMQFAIQLETNVGTMSIVVQGAPSETSQGTHSYLGWNQIDHGKGEGAITITPTEWTGQGTLGVEGCVGTPGVQKSGDVTKFMVNGGFEMSLAGEGHTVVDPTSDSDQ